MSDASTALDRLAEHYGILPVYTDIWGNSHPTSEETKRALLEAMGVTVADDAESEDSYRTAQRSDWRRPLPPVVVLDEDAEFELSLCTTGTQVDDLVHWTVEGENGGEWRGDFPLGTAPVLGTCDVDGRTYERRAMVLSARIPCGYHRLHVDLADGTPAGSLLIVAPRRCHTIEEAAGDRRVWGIAAQLYGLRSARNWGIGDFVDLADLAQRSAAVGADAIGINPVHSGFLADPGHFSPYAPSTRIFLNALYVEPTAVPEFQGCDEARRIVGSSEFQERLAAARSPDLVDYPAVSALKLPVLEALHQQFRSSGSPERRNAFAAFREFWGTALHRHAVFEALHEHFFTGDNRQWSWRTWPEPYRDWASHEVQSFASDHAERVEFFMYVQWLAEEQLEAAQQRALGAGMALGTYRDLAVASDAGGSMAWSYPDVVLSGVSVGAPPDDLGPAGQNWGLSPMSPKGLRDSAYEPFIVSLRANMRHAGAIRIDHVMALTRLFWIPAGKTGRDGAYVTYPFEDLIRIIALESQRNRCVVIGEDLGTLPEGLQPALQRFGVLSYRILMFERGDDGRLVRPSDYPSEALVAAATHDMPTMQGFWEGTDIEWRGRVAPGITPDWVSDARNDRIESRRMLIEALQHTGLVKEPDPGMAEIAVAMQAYLAQTPSRLLMVQIEDLLGLVEQANLPGTGDEHPNWRRKMPCTVDAIFDNPRARRMIEAIRAARQS